MEFPPRPVLRAIAHGVGAIGVVGSAMALTSLLTVAIGAMAVPIVVGGLGLAIWYGATLAIPRKPQAANDNPPTDHMCNWRPYAASTLSCIISDRVGCGKTVSISSASVVSSVLPIV